MTSETSSIARNVLLKQWKEPLKGDFASLVKQDMEDLQINLSLENIATYSKVNFKKLVKNYCEKACFRKLMKEKSEVSKGKEIVYKDFEIQPYLKPGSEFSSDEICGILKCRIRDLDVRGNFPNAYKSIECPFPLCKETESQFHIASCSFYSESNLVSNDLHYEDIFKSDVQKQFEVMKILMKRIEERNRLF